jgi:hypothetical protein
VACLNLTCTAGTDFACAASLAASCHLFPSKNLQQQSPVVPSCRVSSTAVPICVVASLLLCRHAEAAGCKGL